MYNLIQCVTKKKKIRNEVNHGLFPLSRKLKITSCAQIYMHLYRSTLCTDHDWCQQHRFCLSISNFAMNHSNVWKQRSKSINQTKIKEERKKTVCISVKKSYLRCEVIEQNNI